MKLKLLIVALFCSVLGWGQTTIFQFDFEGGTTPSVDNAVGTPAYSVIGTLTSETGTCNGAGSIAHSAWGTNDGYRFTVNTTGYNSLNFSYVERTSNTGISTFLVRASIDGSTWTTIRASYTPPTSCANSGLIALPATFDNQSNVFIEIFKNVNAGSSGNTYRIDDVTLTGTVIAVSSPPVITSALTASANTGAAFSYDITATNAPTSYNATGLPGGLSINTATGQITGSVLVAGTYNVTISATNAYGSDSKNLVITITSGPCYTANAPTFSTSGFTAAGDVDAGGTPTNTIRLASGSSGGSITTTATGVAAGPVTLRFRAKGWSATETSVTVTLDGQAQNVTNVPSAGFDWVELTFASVSANPTLVFSTVANKRVHIGNVEIYCGPITLADIVLHSDNPAVAASTITQAENNHVIYAFDLAVTSANATLNNVVFNTTGGYAASNITNFKLWYSTDATFDSATDIFLDNETTALGAGSHTFTGFTRTINNGTTGYFFITTDIPCAATVANDITVSAITTADLTFVSGNKTGTAFASGTHTIVGATPNNVTSLATSTCENGAATVSWTLPAGCYDNILVFVSDTPFTTAVPAGNGGAYTANTTFGLGTSFDGGFTAYKGTGTSVTITGLTNGTTYYYKAFTRNGLLWSNGVVVSCTPTMAYCASGSTSSGDSEIENVVLNGENNSINNNTANVCTTGVNDYTAMSADLAVGGSYTLTVEFGDCNDGLQYNGAGGVWIDWNNDGDFLDANETIGTALVAVSGGNVIQNFTINVPGGQPIGFYRMRIVQRESGTLGNISPCGTFSWGSTEDYTIEVINACTPTTSVSSIFPTSGPVGTVVTINGSGFTTATSVSFGSVVASFNIISNTVIEVIVPTGATTGNIVIQDAGSCNLSYSSFTVITKDVSSCEGAPVTTDLIIYELHDQQLGDGGFITLYNGTAATVNLSDYSIYRAGDYGAAMSNYATLTGSIAPGALGVVTVDAASCGNATNGDLSAGFNENDQIQLRNAAGTVVIDDVQAYIPGPGYYMVRNAGALSARTTFVAADWSTTPLVAGQCIPSAGLVPPSGTGDSPDVTLNPVDVNASCSSSTATLSVAGTEGVAGGASLAYQWYVNVPGNAGWTAVANGGVYSGATTTTLNISSTSGLNNYQYYCQIRENDATCYTATEAAIVKEGATIWDGTSWSNGTPTISTFATINGNYDTTTHGDFECCSLLVNATFTLNIQADDYVLIQNDLTNNGTLNVFNNGSLVQVNDLGVNTGNILYQRTAMARNLDYVYWSSPVAAFNVNNLPNNYRYIWNTTIANTNGGQGNWVAASGNMIAGKGYIARASNGSATPIATTTSFVGVPNNGVVSMPILRGSYQDVDYAGTNNITITRFSDNWNLVGNPYPSAINVDEFLDLNTNIEGAVRIWTHGTLPSSSIDNPFYGSYQANYTPDDYITHNGVGTDSGPIGFNGFIAGGQGFMINMLDGAAGSDDLIFNNSLRSKTYNNSQFYRTSNEKNRIWLDLINNSNNTAKRTLIGYVGNATNDKDRLYDAFTSVGTTMHLYSIIANDKMTIQGRQLPFDANDKVNLGYFVPASGNYSIGIAALDGLFASGQNIYLEDKLLGVIHDLRSNPYSFSANAGEVNNRFVLRYTNETLGGDDFINNSDVLIFSSDVISVNAMSRTIQNVKIYNVLGQLLLDADAVNSNTFETSKLQKNNTTLLVQVTFENGIKVTKKIVF